MNSPHNDFIAGTQPTAHWAELQEPVTLCPQSVFVIRHVVQKQKSPLAAGFSFGAASAPDRIHGQERIAVRTVAIRLPCVAPSLACIDMP